MQYTAYNQRSQRLIGEEALMVTGLEIQSRSIVLDGKAFGDTGAYEKVSGTMRFAVDPAHPLHQRITDIALASANAEGRVEFSADFYLLKPVDMRKGNRRLLVDVANRGRKVALGMFNSTVRVPDPSTAEDFGNGFLMRQGYTVAWTGWQVDVPRRDGLIALDAPRANGVVGFIRCELRPNERVRTLPLADRYHIPNPVLDLDDREARVIVREHGGAPAVELPRDAWRFPDAAHIEVKGGFTPGALYDVIYRSANPPIVGLGFLAIRDVGAWLRWADAASGNPCAARSSARTFSACRKAVGSCATCFSSDSTKTSRGGWCTTRSCRTWPGARRGEFNLRLGQPSLNATESVGSLPPFNGRAGVRAIA